ncbi:MAG: hypothetical protein ABSG26_14555 [Bryobacteraceae bacterium]|jgi:hypothetical protein
MANVLALEQRVRDDLQRIFASAERGSVTAVCQQVEERLLELVQEGVIGELGNVAEQAGLPFVRGSDSYCLFGDHNFRVTVTAHPSTKNALVVAVRAVDPEHGKLARQTTITMEGSLGRYVEVRLRVQAGLAPFENGLAATIKAILGAGYRWLAEYVTIALRELHSDTAEDLYSHVYQVLPPDVAGHVWLVAIAEDKGLYVAGHLNRDRALIKAAKRLLDTAESPLELASQLLTDMTPFKQMFAEEVLKAGHATPVSLQRATYAPSGFHLAEEAIYQTETIVSHPLVREGRTLMVAGYPTGLRNQIEWRLEQEKTKFKEILEGRAKTLRRLIRHIQRRGVLPDISVEASRCAGAFTGEVIKTLIKK